MNFDQAPLLVIWETTQACDLACVHCRASAQCSRHAKELTTLDGFRLLEQVRAFGNPMMVFTGGDPLKRPDLFDLIARSVELGIRTNVSPSATPLLTTDAIDEFKRLGVARMAIGIDGANAASHDTFRGVPGTFDRAMLALHHARRIGLDTQFQTTVTRRNLADLYRIADLVTDVGSKMWSLFFVVVTGRALRGDDLTVEEYERAFEILCHISQTAPFDVKTTEGMHYRRFVAQQEKHHAKERSEAVGARKVMWRTAGVRDGKGFVFISHTGEIYPKCSVCKITRQLLFPFSGLGASAARLDLLQSSSAAGELFLDGFDGRGPNEGFGMLVPNLEKRLDGGLQVGYAEEDAASDGLVVQVAEPSLDQIHPTGLVGTK